MGEQVRATCPGCQSVLRIPAAWADRAIKCKKCGRVVQGKGRKAAASPTVATPPTLPAATPLPADANGTPPAAPPTYAPPAAYPAPYPADYPQPQAYPYQPTQPQAYPYQATPYPAPAAYPYAVPQSYPQADLDFTNGTVIADHASADPAALPVRRRRRNSGASKFVWVAFALLLTGGLIAGGIYGLPLLKKQSGDQANAADDMKQVEANNSSLKTASLPFPRRMLVISVSKYLYCNGLTAGKGRKSDHVTEVAKRIAFDWRVPQDETNNQLYVLSDTAPKDARAMLRPIIQDAYTQFCATSRAQDRVLIYYGGHAVEKEGKAYLVPVDGDLTDPTTLLPLDDLWAKVQACPAQQKVVVFDVCRINEDDDRVRPGSEPMSKELEAKLLAAPPGVQVVTTCSAGQNALEFRRPPDLGERTNDVSGSLFLSALRNIADKGKAKGGSNSKPDDPLPIVAWLDAATARIKEVAGQIGKPEQTPKMTGAAPTTAVAFNPEESPVPRFGFTPPPPGIPPAEVAKIIERVQLEPFRPRRDQATSVERIEQTVPFTKTVMAAYTPDGMTDQDILQAGDKYPLRKAAIAALKTIREQWKMTGEKEDGEPGLLTQFTGETNDALKKMILERQEVPARAILMLEEQVAAMEALVPQLQQEKSKYWQATFEYALAQAKARLAFMHEYNYALGNIRTDSLPERDAKKGQVGLQLVSVAKMNSKKDVREIADSARELFAKIAEEHKGTPWAVLAKRSRVIALGMKWQPYSLGVTLSE
jgi:hypothetical protein